MKKLLITILVTLFTLFACGKDKESDPIQNIEVLKQKAKTYEALIAENGPYALTTRCDSLTFVGLYASTNPSLVDLYKHFYESTWHRSTTPCYEVGDSRSEISLEGVLSALHFMLSKGDIAGIEQLFQYGEHNDWVFGEGPKEYTRMIQLRPLLDDFLNRKLTTTELELPSFEGYRGNVVALYIALKGRMFDYINGFEMNRLKDLRRAEPTNPIYHALIARYEDGNQSGAISILSDTTHFPTDKLPEQSLELFAWNDAPAATLFMWCVFLMED